MVGWLDTLNRNVAQVTPHLDPLVCTSVSRIGGDPQQEAPGAQAKRGKERGKEDCIVNGQTPERLHVSLFQQLPLVTNGRITKGVSYRMKVDGAELIDEGHPKKHDYPYVDVTTLNSWIQDLSGAILKASIFFVNAYSHVTFISAPMESEASEEDLVITCLLIGFIVADYCAQLALAMRESIKRLRIYRNDGFFVSECSLAREGSVLSTFEWCWTFACLVLVNLVNVEVKLQAASQYFNLHQTRRTGASLRLGPSIVNLAGYRSAWEFYVQNREGQGVRMMLAMCTSIPVVILKVLLGRREGLSAFFIAVNVGLPAVLQIIKLVDAVKLLITRQHYWRRLKEDSRSFDQVLRDIAQSDMERYFGVKPKPQPYKCIDHSGPSVKSIDVCKRALLMDEKVADLNEEIQGLAEIGVFNLKDSLVKLGPFREELQRYSFPCFYEVATLTSIKVGDFPHGLGPFGLTKADIEPTPAKSLARPEAAKSQTPWEIDVAKFPASRLACSYASRGQITGVLSPLSDITLEPDEMAAAGIPEGAVRFAWSYPVVTQGPPEAARDLVDTPPSSHDSFLLYGGYVYFDAENKVHCVLAARLTRDGEPKGLLGFCPPIPVTGQLRTLLSEMQDSRQGRPVSALQGGEACRGLCHVWVSPQHCLTDQPSRGGFLFWHDPIEDASASLEPAHPFHSQPSLQSVQNPQGESLFPTSDPPCFLQSLDSRILVPEVEDL